ncbi:MAG: hypothetical protein ACKV0T_08690 [Planctomycetales bacterium]
MNQCPACNQPVTAAETACPHCGIPLHHDVASGGAAGGRSRGGGSALVVVIVAGIGLLFALMVCAGFLWFGVRSVSVSTPAAVAPFPPSVQATPSDMIVETDQPEEETINAESETEETP